MAWMSLLPRPRSGAWDLAPPSTVTSRVWLPLVDSLLPVRSPPSPRVSVVVVVGPASWAGAMLVVGGVGAAFTPSGEFAGGEPAHAPAATASRANATPSEPGRASLRPNGHVDRAM